MSPSRGDHIGTAAGTMGHKHYYGHWDPVSRRHFCACGESADHLNVLTDVGVSSMGALDPPVRDVDVVNARRAQAMSHALAQQDELVKQRVVLKDYLRMKLDADDLHGVADAAMDIRELDAQLAILRDLAQTVNRKPVT